MIKREFDYSELATQLADGLGALWPSLHRPLVEVATADSIRSFAYACGDDNPLFVDADHGASGAWKSMIGPPLFPLCTGSQVESSANDFIDASLAEALEGVAYDIASETWSFHQPVRPGMRLLRQDQLSDVVATPAGLHAVHTHDLSITVTSTYRDGDDVVATRDRVRGYGNTISQRERAPVEADYSAQEIMEVQRANLAEERRGERTRTGKAVVVGDRLGPVFRGPLTVTDLIEYRTGVGPGPMGAAPLRLGLRSYSRNPRAFSLNQYGVPESRERVHWDAEYARSMGHRSAYDYSHTRLNWLSFLLTDWAGDGGWISSLRGRLIADNHVGDLHRLEGEVVSVRPNDDETSTIAIELAAVNQVGQPTYQATAELRLPESREGLGIGVGANSGTRP